MKRHYKYRFGYINIDEEHIYITATGNWSEVKTLTEKSIGQSKFNNHKLLSFYQYLGIILLVEISFLFSDTTWYLKLGSILLTALLFYKTKDYFMSELGERFLIPKQKILNITQNNEQLKIEFYTLDNQKEHIQLYGVKDISELVICANSNHFTSF